MTFDYDLARLTLDRRHEDAGYRYAEETEDGGRSVMRAAFTPTTPFCPQTHTLTLGSFRAWNGPRERHDYDPARMRAAPSHHGSDAIDERLAASEGRFRETGTVPTPQGGRDEPRCSEGVRGSWSTRTSRSRRPGGAI